ncbi:MAG: DsrE family protein [Gammaproteobacteria bacterium]|jgi:intracellular sulfur oxidation DsrE/DsrF family protein
MRQPFYRLLLLLTILVSGAGRSVWAVSPIDPILQAEHAPPGVVFEIATGKSDSLNWALPLVKRYTAQLHRRFPELHIAVVSHGREMFALKKDPQHATTPAKRLTQQLVTDGVSLHVCGTYAERRGLSQEDFPDYVNVAAEGPAQIKDYIAVGYLHIRLRQPR